MIGKMICNLTLNSPVAFQCNFTYYILLIVLFISGIIEIFTTAEKIGDWKIGLLIFAIGFIFGIVTVYR